MSPKFFRYFACNPSARGFPVNINSADMDIFLTFLYSGRVEDDIETLLGLAILGCQFEVAVVRDIGIHELKSH
jgi:hypothetical protein